MQNGDDTPGLLASARVGDEDARDQLFARHRARLLRMAEVRLDPQLRSRFDPEDVVQESMAEAHRRFGEYRPDGDLPFFTWLRLLVKQQLAQLGRRHLSAQARDARREQSDEVASSWLTQRIVAHITSPSGAAARHEREGYVRSALDKLSPEDREIIVMRHFEQLSGAEAARELGIERSAASKRYVRALQRLKSALANLESDG